MPVPAGAVVLAAGAATRFGSPKQRLFLPAVLDTLRPFPFARVIVVEGAHELELPADAPPTWSVVRCHTWAEGPGASLRCGLQALAAEVELALVVLADGPHLDGRAVSRMLEMSAAKPGTVLAASYDGTRSHPVAIPRARFASTPVDGLRSAPVTLVDCSDLHPPGDVDEPADVESRARARPSGAE